LDAAVKASLPGVTASARSAIIGKYAKRVCGEMKLESDLTPEEKLKIVAFLDQARAGRNPVATATTQTAAEQEAA
jgi:hypothetical protein